MSSPQNILSSQVAEHSTRLAVLEIKQKSIQEEEREVKSALSSLENKMEQIGQSINGRLDTIGSEVSAIHTRTCILEHKEEASTSRRKWIYGIIGTVSGGILVALLKYLLPLI